MQATVDVAPNSLWMAGMIQQVSGSLMLTSIRLRNTTGMISPKPSVTMAR